MIDGNADTSACTLSNSRALLTYSLASICRQSKALSAIVQIPVDGLQLMGNRIRMIVTDYAQDESRQEALLE